MHALTSRHNFRRFEGLVPVYISCLCHHSALQLRFSWQFKYLKSQPCLPERSLPRRISPKAPKGEKGYKRKFILRFDLPRAADSGQSIRSDDPIRLGRADFCDVVQVGSNVVQGRSQPQTSEVSNRSAVHLPCDLQSRAKIVETSSLLALSLLEQWFLPPPPPPCTMLLKRF